MSPSEATSVLVRSKLPDAEYVINPYTGWAFKCRYCYASLTGGLTLRVSRVLDHPSDTRR